MRPWPDEHQAENPRGDAKLAELVGRIGRDDREFVVFCFSKSGDAVAFAKRFGGERLATSSGRWPWK